MPFPKLALSRLRGDSSAPGLLGSFRTSSNRPGTPDDGYEIVEKPAPSITTGLSCPQSPQQWWEDEVIRESSALAILQDWIKSPDKISTEPALMALASPDPDPITAAGWHALSHALEQWNTNKTIDSANECHTLKMYLGSLEE